jgi:hypothetical protein
MGVSFTACTRPARQCFLYQWVRKSIQGDEGRAAAAVEVMVAFRAFRMSMALLLPLTLPQTRMGKWSMTDGAALDSKSMEQQEQQEQLQLHPVHRQRFGSGDLGWVGGIEKDSLFLDFGLIKWLCIFYRSDVEMDECSLTRAQIGSDAVGRGLGLGRPSGPSWV